MELLEREPLLDELADALAGAIQGAGSLVLVGGSAGVGKTSLVHAFTDGLGSNVTLRWGACDPMATPRPLGPLHDLAMHDAGLRALLESEVDRHVLFREVLAMLARPTVLVVEDIHWADDATMDLLRFLGRRAGTTRAVVLATHRDDEVPADHPLRVLLGHLATDPGCRRLQVEPLSLAAVTRMAADQPIDPAHLHRVTGGNPFYVTEVLASPSWTVPPTVADAVLAHVHRLSHSPREVLDLVAAAPGGLELDLLTSMAEACIQGLDDWVGAGLLVTGEGVVTFQHELARLAVYESIPPGRRIELHRRLLSTLEEFPGVPAARLVHHADAAGDRERVLRHARVAAQEASRRGAHREAARHWGQVVAHTSDDDPGALADVLEPWADERRGFDRIEDQRALRARIVALRRQQADPLQVGQALVHLSGVTWTAGGGDRARQLAEEAVTTLQELGPGPELAAACAERGRMAMLARDAADALSWGNRAIEMATDVGAPWALIHALNTVGSTRIVADHDLGGIDELTRSHDLAIEHGDDRAAAMALANLGSGLGEIRAYEHALGYLRDAVDFARDHDIDGSAGYGTAWLARVALEQGRWDEVDEHVEAALGFRQQSVIVPIVALTTAGRLQVRRGDDGDAALTEAWELSVRTGDLQRLWPVAAARAERAWLAGEPERIPDLITTTFEHAVELDVAWAIGELGFWLWRAHALDGDVTGAVEPFALQIAGDWAGAADAWDRFGCPYDRAEALADGDEAAQRGALETFMTLGAEPAADRVRRALRAAGATSVPARPRQDGVAGLTSRQHDVLVELATGATDAEIADRLFISPKTVGHHVSAILHRMDVRSRTEAAAVARDRGLLEPEAG